MAFSDIADHTHRIANLLAAGMTRTRKYDFALEPHINSLHENGGRFDADQVHIFSMLLPLLTSLKY